MTEGLRLGRRTAVKSNKASVGPHKSGPQVVSALLLPLRLPLLLTLLLSLTMMSVAIVDCLYFCV